MRKSQNKKKQLFLLQLLVNAIAHIFSLANFLTCTLIIHVSIIFFHNFNILNVLLYVNEIFFSTQNIPKAILFCN